MSEEKREPRWLLNQVWWQVERVIKGDPEEKPPFTIDIKGLSEEAKKFY